MLSNFVKNLGSRRRVLLKIILFMSVLAFFLLCCFSILRAKNSQKAAICKNAAAYAGIIDERISEKGHTESSAAVPKDFFNGEFPFASSLSTFAVLKDGLVLSTEGYSPLSWKLVATVSEFARTASSAANTPLEAVYTYRDLSLPDYYFYYIPSQADGLSYCYYEPALTGWSLFRESFCNIWGIILLLLLTAILSASFPLIAASKNKAEHQAAALTVLRKNNRPNKESRKKSVKEFEEQQNPKREIEENSKSENESSEESDIFGSRPYFSGIIIDYHNMKGNSVSPDILELFDRIIRENLSVNKILFQLSSQRGSDCLQYYMNYNNYNLRVLCDSLKMNLYNAAPEYAINIFYSDAVSTRQEMENELLYLHQQLRYSLLLGYDFRLSIRQIRSFEASQEKMDAGVASTIQNHLRTRAYEDLYGYLRRYRDTCTHFARPGNIRYSFSEMYRFAEESFSAVKLFFQENAFSHPMVQSTCSTVLRANPGFGHFCDYLISCIRSYQQENQHVLSSRNEQIMNSIYTYIEQDLADANLNSIARKMQMTDSHLSRVFKKNTGTNFSEYLSDRKLEEAAKLLVQDNKIKVADIADMLGYGNPTYFLSRFKAKYGVSPTAYRKTHMTDAN